VGGGKRLDKKGGGLDVEKLNTSAKEGGGHHVQSMVTVRGGGDTSFLWGVQEVQRKAFNDRSSGKRLKASNSPYTIWKEGEFANKNLP